MIDFYQNLYMKIQQRLQVDIPILDFNLVRLQYCIDKVITQRNIQENMLNRKELSVALEFYLQIDGKLSITNNIVFFSSKIYS
jgi:hypothetical protein